MIEDIIFPIVYLCGVLFCFGLGIVCILFGPLPAVGIGIFLVIVMGLISIVAIKWLIDGIKEFR